MAVDRGGLRYPIIVENQFSGTIKDFKTGITSAGKAFDDFKNRVKGGASQTIGAAKGLNQLNQSIRRTEQSQNAAATATERANNAAAASIAVNAQLLNQKKALSGTSNATNTLISGLRKEQAAVNSLASAYKRLAAAKRDAGVNKEARLTLNSNNKTINNSSLKIPSPKETKAASSGFLTLQSILGRTQGVADRASFSLQRLFTVLFAFAVVRTLTQAFTDLISRMITFNAAVERSVLAIASLILATGQVRDATGESVDAAYGLAIAQKEARKQTDLLRRDAILTAATFEQLLETFQTAIGPGLQAGLSLNDIRKFTVQVSQAAAAIGLPQAQLAEEIRSILSGTINIRNTRIAASLGITNEDIRRAKEQGNLLGFLQKRFNAFTIAGQEALTTFDVLLQQVNEGLTLIIGAGGLEFFQALKGVLKEVFDVLTTADPVSGLITPNPEAVNLVKRISTALIGAIEDAKILGKELGFSSFKNVASGVALAITTVSKVLTGFIEGFVKGINTIANIFAFLAPIIEKIFGKKLFDEENLKRTIAVVTQFLTVFLAITLAAKAFAIAISPIAVVVGTAVTAFQGLKAIILTIVPLVKLVAATIASIPLSVIATIAVVALLFEGLRRVLGSFFGIELKAISLLKIIGALGKLVGTTLVNGFLIVTEQVSAIIESLGRFIQHIGSEIADGIKNVATQAIAGMLRGFADALALIPAASRPKFIQDIIDSAATVTSFAKNQKRIDDQASARRKKEIFEVANLSQARVDAYRDEIKAAEDLSDATIKAAILNNDKTPTLPEFAQGLVKEGEEQIALLVGKFKTVFEDAGKGVQEVAVQTNVAANEAVSLSEIFDQLPGVISGSRDSIKEFASLEKDLNEEVEKTNSFFKEGLELLGVSGRVQQQRQEQFKVENDLREKTKKLQIEEKNNATILKGIQATKIENERRVLALTANQQDLVDKGVDALVEQSVLLKDIFRLRQDIAEAQQTVKEETQSGNRAEVDAARQVIVDKQAALKIAEESFEVNKRANDELLKSESVDDQNKIGTLISQRITLAANEKTALEGQRDVRQDILDLERLSQQNASIRIALLAKQESFELRSQTKLNELQTDAARKVFEARNTLPTNQRLVAAEGEVRLAEEQIRQARTLRDLNLENAKIILAQSKARQDSIQIDLSNSQNDIQRNTLQKQLTVELQLQNAQERLIGDIKEANTAKTEEERLKLEQVNEQLLQTRLQIEQPIQTGILDGFRQAAQEIPSLYQGIVETIKTTIGGLTDFISTAIVDAFDPTKDLDIQERFARFLQDIAKQVIQLFTQLAIAKAILGLGFLGGGGGGLLGGIGFAKGGEVPHTGRKAKGFADGGLTRPSHVAASDTIPAWLTPGEHVMPVHRVAQYGADLFEALRKGLIDPGALRAVAGLGGRRQNRVRASTGPGFASGGVVANKVSPANTSNTSSQSNNDSAPAAAFVVANDQNVERLMSGGSKGFLNYLRANRGKVQAILR